MDPIKYFPEEISYQIFSYLTLSELANCCRVSSQWQLVAKGKPFSDALLKKIYELNAIPKISSKELESNDDILNEVQLFLDKVDDGQNAKFCCYFKTMEKATNISIEILGNSENENIDFEENHLATNYIEDGTLKNRSFLDQWVDDSNKNINLDWGSNPFILFRKTIFSEDSSKAILNYPICSGELLEPSTDLEKGISQILVKKIKKNNNQETLYTKIYNAFFGWLS